MRIAIIGATSAIAYETAKHFAAEGADLFLVARSATRLTTIANDLKVRGAGRVDTYELDLAELGQHQALFDAIVQPPAAPNMPDTPDTLDMLLIAHGTLGDQHLCEASVEATLKELTNNFTSVVSLLTLFANYFERQRRGCIAVISSVAGDRGRQSNYVYGTSKAAVSTFLQGLRNRLYKAGVTVLTIKPGFVDTPMTASHKKNLLFASAHSVGTDIYKAMQQGKDVVYTPWFWRPILFVVTMVPERVFKRLSL